MAYKGLTHEEHLNVCDNFFIAMYFLRKVVDKCIGHYPKKSKLMRLLFRIDPLSTNIILKLRSELENTWYKDTTQTERSGHGFIHFEYDKRIKELEKNGTLPKEIPEYIWDIVKVGSWGENYAIWIESKFFTGRLSIEVLDEVKALLKKMDTFSKDDIQFLLKGMNKTFTKALKLVQEKQALL